MLNNQRSEKPDHRQGDLEIVDVWQTIQGEGPYAGCPATFVRLAGCNLQCPACDTNYTKDRRFWTIENLLELAGDAKLVVLTGGEPFRQDIRPFCGELVRRGKLVQVETNGILYLPGLDSRVMVVCSPKTPNIHPKLKVDAFKYVLQAGYVGDDGLPLTALGGFRPARPPDWFAKNDTYLQPLDEQDVEKNQRNTRAVVESCMNFGYRLCLQIQKIVGLR